MFDGLFSAKRHSTALGIWVTATGSRTQARVAPHILRASLPNKYYAIGRGRRAVRRGAVRWCLPRENADGYSCNGPSVDGIWDRSDWLRRPQPLRMWRDHGIESSERWSNDASVRIEAPPSGLH